MLVFFRADARPAKTPHRVYETFVVEDLKEAAQAVFDGRTVGVSGETFCAGMVAALCHVGIPFYARAVEGDDAIHVQHFEGGGTVERDPDPVPGPAADPLGDYIDGFLPPGGPWPGEEDEA
jgi:hypothetical protein